MDKLSPYNHADHAAVAKALTRRLTAVGGLKETQFFLGEAVFALLEINAAIPVQMKYRHLIAPALEALVDGAPESDPHSKSGG